MIYYYYFTKLEKYDKLYDKLKKILCKYLKIYMKKNTDMIDMIDIFIPKLIYFDLDINIIYNYLRLFINKLNKSKINIEKFKNKLESSEEKIKKIRYKIYKLFI